MSVIGTRRAQLGWSAEEGLEFARALKTPLMVQTPLQVILEALFSRIQSQAQVFGEVQRRIDRIEARDINAEEILSRLRLVEQGLSNINHEKLSPFKQEQVLQRLDILEEQVSSANSQRSLEEQGRRPSSSSKVASGPGSAGPSTQELEGRVGSLEQKLAGVYNLQGKLMAVEQMATELGIEVPDIEYDPYTPKLATVTAAAGPVAVAETPPVLSLEPTLFRAGSQTNPQGASSRAQVTVAGMGALARAASSAAAQLAGPQGGLGGSSSSGRQVPNTASGGPVTALVGRATSLGPAGTSAGSGIWPGVKQGVHGALTLTPPGSPPLTGPAGTTGVRVGGTRMADVVTQVEVLTADAKSMQHLISALQEELTGLQGAVDSQGHHLGLRLSALETSAVEMRENLLAEIESARKEVNKPPEVSYADFTQLSSKVDNAVGELATAATGLAELKTQQLLPLQDSITDLKDQVRKLGQPRDMDSMFHQRLTHVEGLVGDVQSSVSNAVQDLMEDLAKASDLNALEQAMQGFAPAAELRQVAAQQAQLVQTVSGLGDWLSMRPETTDGLRHTGASATRFKCLTCDREIKTQGVTAAQESKHKGAFLPRLEQMPLSLPGMPAGPGMHAADVRRAAEERNAGTRSSPPQGTDHESYGVQGVGSQPEKSKQGSPGRVRSAGRQAIPMPNSAFVPKQTPGVQRTPVFIA